MKRKVGIVTGSRAEYGLLYWVIKEVLNDKSFEMQLYVTGMHLSPEFGLTYKLIEQDNIPITSKVEMLLSSDSPTGISKSTGLGVIGFSDAFATHKPDLLIVLGDRFETFAAVIAALFARIPVAHCHGGEVTEGAVDEALRHSITKMAHLHFTSTEEYRKRVMQLGENPDHVYNVGALGLENIKRLKLADCKTLSETIGMNCEEPFFMVTFHPVTLENATAEEQFKELLAALDYFPEARIIFTKPNADTDGRVIIRLIEAYVNRNHERSKAFTSMGQLNYMSALQYATCVIGNSSSGILEVPSFKRPTVDIGDRQRGRIRAESVLHCEPVREQIIQTIRKAIAPDFIQYIVSVKNPYESGTNPSSEIIRIIREIDLKGLSKKKFFSL